MTAGRIASPTNRNVFMVALGEFMDSTLPQLAVRVVTAL
jgi:hypothetical protein